MINKIRRYFQLYRCFDVHHGGSGYAIQIYNTGIKAHVYDIAELHSMCCTYDNQVWRLPTVTEWIQCNMLSSCWLDGYYVHVKARSVVLVRTVSTEEYSQYNPILLSILQFIKGF